VLAGGAASAKHKQHIEAAEQIFPPRAAQGLTMPDPGLVTVASAHTARETMERLLAALKAHNMTVLARIDHAAGAAAAGLPLRATEVVLFGNPKGGTALMQDWQTAGIDLPLKVLVWEDETGKAQLSYNDPQWIAHRHGLGPHSAGAVAAMTKALQEIAAAATTK
jgi:uncharacterized protein (DUF302 family)